MLRCTSLLSISSGIFAASHRRLSQTDDFSKILAQVHEQSAGSRNGNPAFFDGNFEGADRYINNANLSAMQSTLQQNMSPELRASMNGILSQIQDNNFGSLRDMLGNDEGPRMGVMAFGMGENEKGKKVARAAKYEYNDKGESISKDFFEQQLEEDDAQLPKETVEDYSTAGAMEVEFVEDQNKFEKDH